ncbi:glucose-1-phosphate cytidylyltransferase [Candidatus Deianiraea vastatrix]|uniref:Glucose-1-phosphate cytidylyltransferase n=1 Tax=Candidatus Deianiraea vastatrix TaxID=2163644 RepID=A0A5B8XF50_9RICK|nr:glucose-1-phosphate cytidylyltransferase [Candidatus Deianiraea vastatrix]QED23890.1 Glucose-1-phosphate cytidylyltransferase [Candidatus Deianiraea vastatrix]
MKAIILAGGLGSRISEETNLKPKPMIELGGKPILWHIMKIYSSHGINDFVICGGYKAYVIKEYFMNYYMHQSDATFDLKNNSFTIHSSNAEDWRVTVIDTGEFDMTGSRVRQALKYVKDDEAFCITYGDGVADINITESIKFHKSHGKIATVSAVKPTGRFGILDIKDNAVLSFKEKTVDQSDWISGGFFVASPKILNYLPDSKDLVFETQVLPKLAHDGEMMSFIHEGFWHPMDTLRDKTTLEDLWNAKAAPWKIW